MNTRKHADKPCANCGETFRPKRADSKYCSRSCSWANNGKHQKQPDGTECWWVDSKGYLEGRVWSEGSPRRIRRHRWVMEQHIGRMLLPDEVVHHINGDKTDNRIENLQLMAHGEHSRIHNLEREYRSGYTLNLSDEERTARSERMRELRSR